MPHHAYSGSFPKETFREEEWTVVEAAAGNPTDYGLLRLDKRNTEVLGQR